MLGSGTIIQRFRAKLVAQVFTAVAGGVILVFLARILGSDEYGVLFLSLSVVSVGKFLAKLGFNDSAARYITQYKSQKEEQVYHVLRYATGFVLLTSTTVAVVFVAFNSELASVLNEPALTPFLFAAGFYIPVAVLHAFSTGILQGFEEIELASIGDILFTFFEVVAIVALVGMGFGAIGAFWGYTIGYFLALLATGGLVLYTVYPYYQNKGTPEEGLPTRIFKYNIPLTATKTGSLLDKELDTILVGFFYRIGLRQFLCRWETDFNVHRRTSNRIRIYARTVVRLREIHRGPFRSVSSVRTSHNLHASVLYTGCSRACYHG